jgi:hypothetical protein
MIINAVLAVSQLEYIKLITNKKKLFLLGAGNDLEDKIKLQNLIPI